MRCADLLARQVLWYATDRFWGEKEAHSVPLFDHGHHSAFEWPSEVLEALKILRRIEPPWERPSLVSPIQLASPFFEFAVSPDDFRATAALNRQAGPSFDELLTGLVCLMQHGGDDSLSETQQAWNFLIELGLCTAPDRWTEKAHCYEILRDEAIVNRGRRD